MQSKWFAFVFFNLFHNFPPKSLSLSPPNKICELVVGQSAVAVVRLLHQLLPRFRLALALAYNNDLSIFILTITYILEPEGFCQEPGWKFKLLVQTICICLEWDQVVFKKNKIYLMY